MLCFLGDVLTGDSTSGNGIVVGARPDGRINNYAAFRFRTILPMCSLLSMSACALATSASGKTL